MEYLIIIATDARSSRCWLENIRICKNFIGFIFTWLLKAPAKNNRNRKKLRKKYTCDIEISEMNKSDFIDALEYYVSRNFDSKKTPKEMMIMHKFSNNLLDVKKMTDLEHYHESQKIWMNNE